VPAATNKALAPKEVTFANNAFHGQGITALTKQIHLSYF